MISITGTTVLPSASEIEARRYAAELDRRILSLWADEFDTVDIARVLGRPEFYVANRLARLRDAGAL